MIFTSYNFLLFLGTVWAVYWLLPHKAQNVFLLLASYFFYGFIHPWYCILLFGVSLISFITGYQLVHAKSKSKIWLSLGIAGNLLVLGYFKYYDFFLENFNLLLQNLGLEPTPLLHVLLPVGISFYVFQGIGYIIDCYRGEIDRAPKLLDFLLFLGFFPQLVAGPIERSTHLLPQIEEERKRNLNQQSEGIYLIALGVFKKLVIADNIALYVNPIFAVDNPSFLLILVGSIGFSVQILADFSAYTDIARGSAKLLGFDLLENFRLPYLASNISDFWRRWHMSLSRWIKDYLYIPLGGSRVSRTRFVFNIVITMLLCGLWHGAAWTFVFWGAYHGILMALFRLFQKSTSQIDTLQRFFETTLWKAARIIITYLIVLLGWTLFRAPDMATFLLYFSPASFAASAEQMLGSLVILFVILAYASPLIILALVQSLRSIKTEDKSGSSRSAFRPLSVALLSAGILFLSANLSSEFIYFQF